MRRSTGPTVRLNTAPYPLAKHGYLVLGGLVVGAAVAWAILVQQSVAMGGSMMPMTAPTYLFMWFIMMVAVMFPSATPMVLMFHRIHAGKRQRGQPFVSTWVFVAAYLTIWTLLGALAYAGQLGVDVLTASFGTPMDTLGRIGGAFLVLAGIYQFTPLKYVCLSKCRTPLTFILTSWRDGVGGAFRMGAEHGLYCAGCCWLLFALLLPLGMMNVFATVVITLLILAEKILPLGERVALGAGVLMIAYGALVLIVPDALMPAMMM